MLAAARAPRKGKGGRRRVGAVGESVGDSLIPGVYGLRDAAQIFSNVLIFVMPS